MFLLLIFAIIELLLLRIFSQKEEQFHQPKIIPYTEVLDSISSVIIKGDSENRLDNVSQSSSPGTHQVIKQTRSTPSSQSSSINIHSETQGNSSKNTSLRFILLYNSFFSSKDWGFGFGRSPFIDHNCAVTNCYITNNRTTLGDISGAIFHYISTRYNFR